MGKPTEKTSLWELFSAFFRIGLFTFGGGYAMLPMLERECVEKHRWAGREELLDYFAIGQCTPGIIAVNTATFIGSAKRGTAGAAAATAGVVCPGIMIILLIARMLADFADMPAVRHAFGGIRAAVAVLIINAAVKLIKTNVKSPMAIILCAAAFIASLLSVSPAVTAVSAGLAGMIAGKAGSGK